MAQYFFEVEKGFSVTDAGSNTVRYNILHGSGAPLGTSGDTDTAPIGSVYVDYTNGKLYIKETSTSQASDWVQNATIGDVTNINWRSEKIIIGTNDAVPGGSISGFSDDEAADATEFIHDLASDSAHQDIQFAGAVTGATATGLSNDATVYTMTVNVNGSPQAISVVGSAAQTITTLLAEINADLTGVTATFDDTNDLIKIDHDTAGSGNTIVVVDTDLVSSLTAGGGASLSVQYRALTSGDYVLFDADGTTLPTLLKADVVTDGTGTTFTASGVIALSDNEMMIIRNYLPDSPHSQEAQAIVLFNGTSTVKVGDFNWDLATGINLSSGYSAGPGGETVAAGNTLEAAISKLDGNQQEIDTNVNDLITLSGVAENSTDLGTFTGTIITDNTTIKAAIQELETDLDALQTLTGVAAEATDLGTFTGSIIPDTSTIKAALQALETAIEANDQGTTEANNVTTTTVLDSVLVDSVYAVKWFIHATDEAGKAMGWEVWAVHNGHAAADATAADFNVSSKLKIGAPITGAIVSVDLNGAAGAQVMRLNVEATGSTDFRAKRLEVIEIA